MFDQKPQKQRARVLIMIFALGVCGALALLFEAIEPIAAVACFAVAAVALADFLDQRSENRQRERERHAMFLCSCSGHDYDVDSHEDYAKCKECGFI